eukprot:CAMPEP_0170134754 /NCGR_PEP_ID=MMETSP0033_2-20121228/2086_1 /TAXON_ID=195969 /ORGANISM="Dolichomastix tenuilepis, Strain CCMP3274" /LENGTH=306 /DNA_ID=CAMNT_0010370323 /DNA_START=41 /DNA_END=961 /DNA_ORIENTATION=+
MGMPVVAAPAVEVAEVGTTEAIENGVVVRSLSYSYPGTERAVVSDMSLTFPAGSRVLLCGANGAGKTTLLQVLAGKTMVSKDAVRVLGRPPFHDTELTCGGDLSYLGSTWRRNVAFAGFDVPLAGDFPAGMMIYGVQGVDPERRERLIKLLDIDPTWSMMAVSDGQRRRVQICLGLLKPFKVLLCDEITVDLDVLGRLDLLRFLRSECEERGAVVIYATHIFDGMDAWISHLAFVANGQLKHGGEIAEVKQLTQNTRLLKVMETWLREDRVERKKREADAPPPDPRPKRSSPFGLSANSKHLMYFK